MIARVSVFLTFFVLFISYCASAETQFQTLDDKFLAVAKNERTFAGLYVDGNRLVINITEKRLSSKRKMNLISTIRDVFGGHINDYLGSEPIFKKVTYPVADLINLHLRIIDIHNEKDVLFTDMDERKNRVVIGIRPEGDHDRIRNALAKFYPQPEMVVIEEHEIAIDHKSVRDRFRPLVAGIQLDIGFFAVCTIGAVVEFPNGRGGAITNSHCSDMRGIADGTNYKQPVNGIFGSNAIGLEIADPAWNVVSSRCPSGRDCRFTDSNMIQIDTGVDVDRGSIARVGSWGSRQVSTVDADYDTTQLALFTLTGEALTKVGRTTGKTAGVVDATCLVTDVVDSSGNPTNFTRLCDNRMTSTPGVGGGVLPLSGGGDSGSPVFRLLPAPNATHDVRQHGIHMAGNGTSSLFSPMLFVVLELQADVGPFTVVQ